MKALLNLFWVFFKIGLTTFGGGYAMIPIIKEQIVEKRKWMSDDDVLEIIAIGPGVDSLIAIISKTSSSLIHFLFSTICSLIIGIIA